MSPYPIPSVGSVTKKIMKAHPELTTGELIAVIRESLEAQGAEAGDFATHERVNEAKALDLARARVLNRNHPARQA